MTTIIAGLTSEMVLDRTRLLALADPPLPHWHVDCGGEGHELEEQVRDCRTCAPVCYPHETSETAASYVEAAALLKDEFDTSGTPHDFCEDCGHAPCVAGGKGWCGQEPRFIVVQAIDAEIRDLAVDTILRPVRQEERALRLALWTGARGLSWAAWKRGMAGDSALGQLALMRQYLRDAKEAQS